MRLMLDLLHASHCRSTHHKLAIDALRRMQGPRRERWTRMVLKHYEQYLRGAKDPDTKFRDFRNHVLHVRDNYWGGAITASQLWYHEVTESLRARDFSGAVYAAGVLSHYVTDPIMPFHTAQSEAETNIHRAAEWSVTTTYDALVTTAAARRAAPKLTTSAGSDWLADHVIAGAEEANQYYETLIEHYDFTLGRRNPKAGWDATGREILGGLLLYAAESFAQVLDRAFDEAEVDPPHVQLMIETLFATMKTPFVYVARKIDDHRQRRWIEAMYEEWQTTGRVDEMLADDDRAIRDMYAKEVAATRSAGGGVGANLAKDRAHALARANATVGSKPSRGEFQRDRDQPSRRQRRQSASDDHPATTTSASSVERPRVDPPHESPAKTEERQPSRFSVGTLSSKVRDRFRRETDDTPEPAVNRAASPASSEPPTEDIDQELARIEQALDAARDDMQEDRQARETEYERDQEPNDAPPRDEPSHEQEDRFYLEMESSVQDAPSIGSKTARRLAKIGVRTVADLLELEDPAEVTARLGQRWITEQTLCDWQDQASLAYRIPFLRGHDAQILVACGFRMPEEVANCKPADILKVTIPFCDSSEGKRVLRGGKAPDKHEVRDWIQWASRARDAA